MLSLKLYKCIVIILFIYYHVATWSEFRPIAPTFFYNLIGVVIRLVALSIPFLAGAQLRVSTSVPTKFKNDEFFQRFVKICLFLSLFEIIKKLFITFWPYAFSWDSLQLIAFSYLSIGIILKYFDVKLLSLVALIVPVIFLFFYRVTPYPVKAVPFFSPQAAPTIYNTYLSLGLITLFFAFSLYIFRRSKLLVKIVIMFLFLFSVLVNLKHPTFKLFEFQYLMDNWDSFFQKTLAGDLNGIHIWPIVPWTFFVWWGYLVTDYLIKTPTFNKLKFTVISLLIIGVVHFIYYRIGYHGHLLSKEIRFSEIFVPDNLMILDMAYIFIFSLIFSSFIESKITLRKYGVINCFSQGILWIYFIHMVFAHKLTKLNGVLKLNSVSAFLLFYFIVLVISYMIGVATVFFTTNRIRVSVRK